MKQINVEKVTENIAIPTVIFGSDRFKCPRCDYTEYRKVLGDVSKTKCPECGYPEMYRIKD